MFFSLMQNAYALVIAADLDISKHKRQGLNPLPLVLRFDERQQDLRF